MKLMLLLSKENIKLAEAEAQSMLKFRKSERHNDLILFNTTKTNYSRLAYTKKVFKHLFTCNKSQLKDKLKRYNWQKIYKSNFCIRIKQSPQLEKEYAGFIWEKVKAPKVNLKNPETRIEVIFHKNKAFIGLFLEEIQSIQHRHPNKRPFRAPTTLNPKLARALINLSGVEKGTLLDPFCGTGGILIEAGLLNYKILGYDISKELLTKCEFNLKYYNIKNYKLKNKDALTKHHKTNAIVTDLPYGRCSLKKGKKLYEDFLNNIKVKVAVLVFPNRIPKIPKRFKIINKFKLYVHGSLTRNIIILKHK